MVVNMSSKVAVIQNIARRILMCNKWPDVRINQSYCQYHSCRRHFDNDFTNPTAYRLNQTGSCVLSRSYAKKLSFTYSGDLARRKPLNEKQLVYSFKGLTETLEESPDVVHKLSSLQYADGRGKKYHRLEEMYDRIDDLFGSSAVLEQRVAKLTVDIRSLVPHCLKFRQDKYTKSRLVEKIQMRKKLLKYLRRDDYERFLWLLRELRIRYIPTPEYHGQVTNKFRKKRAVVKAAFEVRKQKLTVLREQLEAERNKFEEYKEKTLEQIEKDLKVLNLDGDELEKGLSRKAMTKREAKRFQHNQKTPN